MLVPALRSVLTFLFAFLPTLPAFAAASPWSLEEALGAPEGWRVSGGIRARYETLAGQPKAGVSVNDDLISFRTTLFGEYDFGIARIGAELYDSRAYGGTSDGSAGANEVNALELVQAYLGADFADPFGEDTALGLQAGRVILNLGSRRLVAADDYRNTTTGSTGLRADIATGRLSTTLIYVLPQIRLPDDKSSVLDNAVAFDEESFDLTLWGGIASLSSVAERTSLDAAFYRLDERDAPERPTRNRGLNTISLRAIRAPAAGQFDYELEGIYQWGNVRDGLAANAAELDVSAWFVHADAGFTFDTPWKPRLSVELDYASGDEAGGAFTRFDTLFGMRRADLAPAGIYAALARTNILTPALRLEMAPSPRFDAFMALRGVWLASSTDSFSGTSVRDASGASGDFAGYQWEGRARYWLVPDALMFEADAVILFKGRFLEAAPNVVTPDNARYLSFNLNAFF